MNMTCFLDPTWSQYEELHSEGLKRRHTSILWIEKKQQRPIDIRATYNSRVSLLWERFPLLGEERCNGGVADTLSTQRPKRGISITKATSHTHPTNPSSNNFWYC